MTLAVITATGATQTIKINDDLVGTAGAANANALTVQGISGGVALPVSLATTPGLTDTQLRAAAVPVSLASTPGLTDTQLRASAVPVSLATAPALVASSAIIGNVRIDQTTPGTTNGVQIAAAIPAGTNIIGAAFQGVSATQATGTTARLASAASTNATSVKGSAGNLYRVTAANTNAAARYLKFYNKASAPTVGTDVPLFTLFLPAGGGFSEEFDIPVAFSTGIAYAMTTGVADTDTAAVSLNDVHGLIIYA